MLYALIFLALAVAAFFAHRAWRDGRWSVAGVTRRATTWLGLLVLAQGGAVLAYNSAPDAWKAALPENLSGYLLIGMMVLGALNGVASSIRQKSLGGGS